MNCKINQSSIIKVLLILSLWFVMINVEAQKKSVRIGLAQIFCLDSDRSGNLVRIENAVKEAQEKGAEIVCFPETSILGWVNPDAHERAYPIPGEDSERLSRMARDYNLYICIGLAEKDEEKLYDSVILIDDNGNIILKHRKINTLDELMSRPYTPGTEIKTVDTKYGRIGMLVCADSFKEEILLEMKKQKPGLMLIPYGWAAPEDSWPGHSMELEKTVCKAAITIGSTVVGTDLVGQITNGPWAGLTYGGASVVSDKDGNILATGRDRDRDIILIDIKL
jgi:predicted amidohydrolase